MNKAITFILAIVLLASCNRPTIKEEAVVSNANWTYADTLQFDFDITDTVHHYNLFLKVEHLSDYQWQNFYTMMNTIFPDGKNIEDLVSLELADKAGNWHGKCRGENCTVWIPIQENAVFNQEGQYRIQMAQYMRRDSIPGIKKITFIAEKAQE